MVSTYTDNFELVKQGVGDSVDQWGDPILNTNMIQRVDDVLGKTTEVALTSSNVSLTLTQWRTKALKLTGTISADITISLPLSINSVGSATAVGGEFIVDNETAGAFRITIQTLATGSTGVEVPQGYRSTLYSNTVSVAYADDQSRSTVQTYAGNPNGNVAGTAGSITTPASIIYDRTNGIYYICTTSGIAASAIWSALTGPVPAPGGYLTTSSSTDNIIQTGDAIGATTLYYTPYTGNFVPVFNGTSFIPTIFSQLALALSSSQASNSIYDVFLSLDSGVLKIGFGPAWTGGSGGSVTAGSCARGTGAGGTAIQRVNGIWLNTNSMTANNGISTYSIPAQRGTYIGSVFIDSTQGQVTCHRSWGSSRKWGVWNAYNRLPIFLKAGDSTASWNIPTGSVIRQSDAAAGNTLALFMGLAEETFQIRFDQNIEFGSFQTGAPRVFIGVNSTTAGSGFSGRGGTQVVSGGTQTIPYTNLFAELASGPLLGLNNFNCLEQNTGSAVCNGLGTEPNMVLLANYRG